MAEFILGTIAGFVLGIVVVFVLCFRIIREIVLTWKIQKGIDPAKDMTRTTTTETVNRNEPN